MTVSSSTSKVSYSGNGSLTVFAYTFKIFDQDDLTVILRASDGTETVQTITTHYTVSGVGSAGGGNVTFVTAPASGVTVVILREQPLTQELDLVPNDPFPAQSLEESLDKLVFMVQAHSEELDRAIKASKTNVISGSEFTISAADRANKIFAFDSSGDVSITQEIGVYRGNWATSTAYNQRDIVKDTSNNNIYICNTAHTSSGSTPISSNADTAKWYLLVDAASATSSASAAAASETAAQAAQTAAETAQTAAEAAQTAAETAQTNAETAETNAETAQTAAEAAQAAAELAYDNFDDRYLGAKASDPTLDNDGNALIDGALYFDTTNNVMKVYDLGGTAWRRTTPTTSDQTNINTVSGIAANVTTVAGISGDVTTVAGISADVTTVAADGTDIGTVAGISANVTTVAGVSGDVTTVSGISGNVTTVAGISANVTTVAGVSANVTTVAGVSADVTTVAGISADVTTVATNNANITTVATNIAGVNSFAERYRVASADPTTSLDAGDLAFNTTASLLKYYNGTSWQSISPGIGAVSDDASPQLGGNLDLNSNNITGTGNINTTGSATFTSSLTALDASFTGTGAIDVPSGTTAQRPTGSNGMIRYNSDDAQFEGYADGAWGAIAGGGGDTQTATTTSTTQTAIASYTASTSLGIEIVVIATDTVATERTITKLLVTHDGTTAVATQYGEVNTDTAIASYDVDISGGNVRLLATAASANSTNFTAVASILA